MVVVGIIYGSNGVKLQSYYKVIINYYKFTILYFEINNLREQHKL